MSVETSKMVSVRTPTVAKTEGGEGRREREGEREEKRKRERRGGEKKRERGLIHELNHYNIRSGMSHY